MKRIRLLLSVLFLLAVRPALSDEPRPERILFVGNSLTHSNDLPAMVARIARLDDRPLEIHTLAEPNYSLGDHLASAGFAASVQKGWDFLVLQQGPSSLPDSRAELIRDVRAIDRIAAGRSSPRLALLMAWPPAARSSSWDRVTESYRLAASGVGAVLIPAGANLRRALREDPTIPLLAGDGFHPAVSGTYLAALTTYHALRGSLPPGCGEMAVARAIAGTALGLTEAQLNVVVRSVGAGAPSEQEPPAPPAAPRDADRAALLALHQKVMVAHREGNVEMLLEDGADDSIIGNRGAVTRPPLAEQRARLGPYLSSTRFDFYRDRIPPIVRVSDDGSLGWVIVEVEAKGTQRSGDGTEAPLEFVSAWIELYEKRAGRWYRVGNVSNFKP